MAITIVLADDHSIVRQGIRLLINGQPDMQVVGEADNGTQAVELVRELKPNVVVIDVKMPILNGIEATRQIMREMPDTKVLVLSMHSDWALIERMQEAGASGYMLKDCAFDELARAIRDVATDKEHFNAGCQK